MSQSSRKSSSRDTSEETWKAKRTAENDEDPTFGESKRVRRGSSTRVDQEPIQDFIVVSTGKGVREGTQAIEQGASTSRSSSAQKEQRDTSVKPDTMIERSYMASAKQWNHPFVEVTPNLTSSSTKVDVSSLANPSEEVTRTVLQDPTTNAQFATNWCGRDESRQLPPLPAMKVPLTGPRRDSLQYLDSQRPDQRLHATAGLEGGLNTFSSNFSVLTTDSIQKNHANGSRVGRKRGRKPASMSGQMRFDERPPTSNARGDFEDVDLSIKARNDGVHVRSLSSLPSPRHTPNSNNPFTTRATSSQHPISPITAIQTYHPPPATFNLDNTVESPLPPAELDKCIESIRQHANLVLAPVLGQESRPYPIDEIMFHGLTEFYKWFGASARTKEIGPLMFELLDVHWQEERSFVVPDGSLSYYRIIKQYIWDFYWLAVNINNAPTSFRVLVRQFIPQVQALPGTSKSYPGPGSRPTSRHMHTRQLIDPMRSNSPTSPRRQAVSPRSATFNSPPYSNHTPYNGRPESVQRNPVPGSPSAGIPRTAYDQNMLRERALAFTDEREDVEILDHESTVLDKLPYKTGADVCGVVIDKRSGDGMVAVTGKGYITLNVETGPDEPGDRYQDVAIQPKQICMLHGAAVVLFYKRRSTNRPQQSTFRRGNLGQPQRPRMGSDVDIVFRLQIDGNGKFSHAFDKSILRPKITTAEFFSWFANQSGHCLPQGPPFLKFTFKDAMPTPKSTEIARGNEDHFTYMRKDIKVQCEKAKKFMDDMKEFVILVTVPGWQGMIVDEEEEW